MNQSSLPRRFLSFSSTALQNSGGARGLVIVALVALSIGFGACQKGGGRPTDGGADKAGTSGDGGGGAQAKTDAKTDATATDGGDGGKSNRCSTSARTASVANRPVRTSANPVVCLAHWGSARLFPREQSPLW